MLFQTPVKVFSLKETVHWGFRIFFPRMVTLTPLITYLSVKGTHGTRSQMNTSFIACKSQTWCFIHWKSWKCHEDALKAFSETYSLVYLLKNKKYKEVHLRREPQVSIHFPPNFHNPLAFPLSAMLPKYFRNFIYKFSIELKTIKLNYNIAATVTQE